MSKFLHPLGVKAKDKITGFQGIIIGRGDYLTGCNTYGLKPQVDKEGKTRKAEWFDEGSIEVIGKGIKAENVAAPKKGGPLTEHPPG